MKPKIGTIVLFALLILTIIAIQRIDTPSASASDTMGSQKQTLYKN